MSAPFLVTERFDLCPFALEDLEELLALVSHPETRRFLGREEPTLANHWQRILRGAGGWALYGYGPLAVRERGKPAIIGSGGIFPSWREEPAEFADVAEAGWIVRADRIGQGVASEVMRAVLQWFDAEHGDRVVCMIDQANAPSIRLAGKLGFGKTGSTRIGGDTLDLFDRPAARADTL